MVFPYSLSLHTCALVWVLLIKETSHKGETLDYMCNIMCVILKNTKTKGMNETSEEERQTRRTRRKDDTKKEQKGKRNTKENESKEIRWNHARDRAMPIPLLFVSFPFFISSSSPISYSYSSDSFLLFSLLFCRRYRLCRYSSSLSSFFHDNIKEYIYLSESCSEEDGGGARGAVMFFPS